MSAPAISRRDIVIAYLACGNRAAEFARTASIYSLVIADAVVQIPRLVNVLQKSYRISARCDNNGSTSACRNLLC